MKKSVIAVVAALALLVPVSSASASEERPLQPCPPGTFGVTVYYQHPQGWITVDIPLCFSIQH